MMGHGWKSCRGGSLVRMGVMMAVRNMTMDRGMRLPAFALHLGGCAGEHIDIKVVSHGRPWTVSLAAPMQR